MGKRVGIAVLLLLLVCMILYSSVPTVQARVDTILWNTLLKGKLTCAGATPYKYHYFPMAFGSAQTYDMGTGTSEWISGQTIDIGGGADMLGCAGIAMGQYEIGSIQGYITMAESTDVMRFRFHMPETFVDTGTQKDLLLQFNVEEQVTIDAITYDVNIYEYGNTTPIISDQFTAHNGDAKAWVNLVTNSAGIGNDSDIDADDILVIVVTPEFGPPEAIDHRTDIYGCRIRYRAGIEATEELE